MITQLTAEMRTFDAMTNTVCPLSCVLPKCGVCGSCWSSQYAMSVKRCQVRRNMSHVLMSSCWGIIDYWTKWGACSIWVGLSQRCPLVTRTPDEILSGGSRPWWMYGTRDEDLSVCLAHKTQVEWYPVSLDKRSVWNRQQKQKKSISDSSVSLSPSHVWIWPIWYHSSSATAAATVLILVFILTDIIW